MAEREAWSRGARANRHVIVFVKEPKLGRVKRRLAADIGAVPATAFYRTATRALLRRLAPDRRWRIWLAVTPDAARGARWWPVGLARLPQGQGDLGRRMLQAFRRLPPGPAVLIGSDIPGIRAAHLGEAFARLRGADMVLGPAEDGGYWLVGFARGRRAPDVFRGVRWSTPHALADTRANAAGLAVATAALLADVDDGAAWRAWLSSRGRRDARSAEA